MGVAIAGCCSVTGNRFFVHVKRKSRHFYAVRWQLAGTYVAICRQWCPKLFPRAFRLEFIVLGSIAGTPICPGKTGWVCHNSYR